MPALLPLRIIEKMLIVGCYWLLLVVTGYEIVRVKGDCTLRTISGDPAICFVASHETTIICRTISDDDQQSFSNNRDRALFYNSYTIGMSWKSALI